MVIGTICAIITTYLAVFGKDFGCSPENNKPKKVKLSPQTMKCIDIFNIAIILDKSNSLVNGVVLMHFVYPKKEGINVEEVRDVTDIIQVDLTRFNLYGHKSCKGEVIELDLGVSGKFIVQVTLAKDDNDPSTSGVAGRVDFLISRADK